MADSRSISSVTRPFVDLAIGRLEEAVFVRARVDRERVDEADVRAFGVSIGHTRP
jgi:hypothetical protein